MENALDAMRSILDQIDVLCVPSIEKSKELHQNLKELFDISIQSCPEVELGPLMELYVTNMDSESIWEQVQSRNRPLNRYIELHAKKMYQSVPPVASNKSSGNKKTPKTKDIIDVQDEDIYSDDSSDGSEEDMEEDQSDESGEDEEEEEGEASHSEGEDMDNWLDVMDEAESARLEVGLGEGRGLCAYVCICITYLCVSVFFCVLFLHCIPFIETAFEI
jgi:hypothetical protein